MPADSPKNSTKPVTVLVVEDNDALQRLISYSLRLNGYRVEQAETAEEALRWASPRAAEIDVLLTDEVMPGFSGVQLASDMRQIRPDLRVICMSGLLKEDVMESCASGLVSAFLMKPFPMSDLTLTIEKTLAEGRVPNGPRP